MATEIERKFLVRDDSWREQADGGEDYRQGYLHSDASLAVRVRLGGEEAWLTIKSSGEGLVRREYEYAIPSADAREMLDQLCHKPLIEKRRYLLTHAGHTWEIDVFAGDNQGLVVAEIELGDPGEVFERPAWLGKEVTQDPRYLNSSLSRHPYRLWSRA